MTIGLMCCVLSVFAVACLTLSQGRRRLDRHPHPVCRYVRLHKNYTIILTGCMHGGRYGRAAATGPAATARCVPSLTNVHTSIQQ